MVSRMRRAPCHRRRRRATQYCRGADDQSPGRGVLATRFRGYDHLPLSGYRFRRYDDSKLCVRCLTWSQECAALRVIAGEGGRPSIAEEPMINRQAAAYWLPAFAVMTICRLVATAFAAMTIQNCACAV